jgi:hypothetical protein
MVRGVAAGREVTGKGMVKVVGGWEEVEMV